MGVKIKMKKPRVRKLSFESRIRISKIYLAGELTMKELAKMFEVSESRISQIVTDYYGESEYVQ